MKNKEIIGLALAGLLSANVAYAAAAAADAKTDATMADKEKCYGISEAGKNDCKTDKHSCKGNATTANDPKEWVLVNKGDCAKKGGKTEAAAEPATEKRS